MNPLDAIRRWLPSLTAHRDQATGLSRRRFLASLGGMTAAAAAAPLVDWDRLLWVPDQMIAVPELAGGFVTMEWLAREAMAMFANNLKFVSLVDRQYEEAFAGKYQLIDAKRIGEGAATDQLGIDMAIIDGDLTDRANVRERLLGQSMAFLASEVKRRQVVAFGELDHPCGGVESARVTDSAAGVSLRAIKGYDMASEQPALLRPELLRFDVLVSAKRPA